MRIEKGKYYRTRDGRKVGPIEPWTHPDKWEWMGTEPGKEYEYLWDANGVNYDGAGSPHDLVAEWSEGPVVTETVQRIKPGVYGPLGVGAEISIPDCDRPDQPPPREIEAYLTKFCLDASEWRELARVALEIAEYLDAQ